MISDSYELLTSWMTQSQGLDGAFGSETRGLSDV